uniref:EB domain-containing protein n=1 Tax=Globodera pallida TaxID=36090 RepID=A0A183BMW1_GLOPA
MYNNVGFAYIQIENCIEKEEYCSVVSCVKGDLVMMTWACEKHNNCTKIADRLSDANTTCRCKMGKKGVNLSNVKLSFPPEAPAVTTEANVGLCAIPTILFSVPVSIGITLLFLTTGVDYRFSAA